MPAEFAVLAEHLISGRINLRHAIEHLSISIVPGIIVIRRSATGAPSKRMPKSYSPATVPLKTTSEETDRRTSDVGTCAVLRIFLRLLVAAVCFVTAAEESNSSLFLSWSWSWSLSLSWSLSFSSFSLVSLLIFFLLDVETCPSLPTTVETSAANILHSSGNVSGSCSVSIVRLDTLI